MNIFRRFRNWLEWRRRDREETVVATAEYRTVWTKDGKETGEVSMHVLSFFRDGNGVRYSEVETGNKYASDTHSSLMTARVNWRVHGDLPSHARHVRRSPKAMLTVIDGGAA